MDCAALAKIAQDLGLKGKEAREFIKEHIEAAERQREAAKEAAERQREAAKEAAEREATRQAAEREAAKEAAERQREAEREVKTLNESSKTATVALSTYGNNRNFEKRRSQLA